MKKIVVSFLTFALIIGLYGCSDAETEKAKNKFNENVATIEKNNTKINKEIKALKKLLKSDDKPLESSVKTDTRNIIKEAKEEITTVPDCPSSKEDIVSENKKLKKNLDKTSVIDSLKAAKTNYKNSIKQRKQLTNPSEEFVINRLNGIPNITEIQAVTEDNDPNGNLNKKGGYTATVYFSSDLVDTSANYITGDDAVARGTDGGGSIEVYKTEKDAKKREAYLSTFDGTALASGSHKVVGTVLIRTSDYLTASQQTELETNIYNKLIELQ